MKQKMFLVAQRCKNWLTRRFCCLTMLLCCWTHTISIQKKVSIWKSVACCFFIVNSNKQTINDWTDCNSTHSTSHSYSYFVCINFKSFIKYVYISERLLCWFLFRVTVLIYDVAFSLNLLNNLRYRADWKISVHGILRYGNTNMV